MTVQKVVKLNDDGVQAPVYAFGTASKLFSMECKSEVVMAISEAGVRHIDTAAMYRNEASVGRAIGLGRHHVFLTSKCDENVPPTRSLTESLKVDRRGPFDIKKPGDLASDVDVMSAVCRRLAGQRPHLFTEEGALTLELECCALVTSPPVTGLILRLETYEPLLRLLDYDVMVTNGDGVTLMDVLLAIGQWMSKRLSSGQQYCLWQEMLARSKEKSKDWSGFPTFRSVPPRYRLPSDASMFARKAIEEQFLADHLFRMDLGRDLIEGGFYQCSVQPCKGTIIFRLQ
ncbi:hypothetical protein NliqN6_1767 [Naganishia liquefaciens]|uniref:NADP-dependent oxidoreductase domain-containing protein n=1 Tax=Naganishia liquefaciens TaxID=104408 RepID=A0A8H3TRM7_9TREE|nr:hypothetical protein NliqN6_1767 [Naganishia liquefaciens]